MGIRRRREPPHDSTVIHEPSSDERDRNRRRQRRQALARRVERGAIVVLVIGLVAAAGVVGAGLTGRGPYAHLASREPAATITTAPTVPGTTPGTTAQRLTARTYRRGDCVVWDQSLDADVERRTDVVPCDAPHLIEISEGAQITAAPDHVPTSEEIRSFADPLCAAPNQAYLGAPLDPHGRYHSSHIRPTVESWQMGDRQVWCGVGTRDRTQAPDPLRQPTSTGTVSAEAQFWTYEPGECLTTESRHVVPCTEPHRFEVTGESQLTDDITLPALDDTGGWGALVGETCRHAAGSYLGRPVSDPWHSGWLPIESESWAAGKRNVTCFVGRADGGGTWAELTGSARATSS